MICMKVVEKIRSGTAKEAAALGQLSLEFVFNKPGTASFVLASPNKIHRLKPVKYVIIPALLNSRDFLKIFFICYAEV